MEDLVIETFKKDFIRFLENLEFERSKESVIKGDIKTKEDTTARVSEDNKHRQALHK